MSFIKLGLTDQLVQGILSTGYTAPTAIQSRAIPSALAGRDIIGCARTGTGKTAAFVLPMLNHLTTQTAKHVSCSVRALILTPTRELAQQVDDFVLSYGRYTELKSIAVFGGVNMESQIKHLRRGVDIVAATPGRLLDHLQRKTIDLSHVEILVLDEADRMFDMGFINDVRKIIGNVPAKRQTLLFSATMPREVRELVASVQKDPELIEIGEQRQPVETVRQHFYRAPQEKKMELLFHILRTQEMASVLVFSRTKHRADKISHRLHRNGIASVAIHSNRTQAQRQRALSGFKQGQYKVMVATDIAARGIDVEGITHVVNYDTPAFPEDYIHRIGRTGRADAAGDAITFVSNQEERHLQSIERFVDRRFELKCYPGFTYAENTRTPEKDTDTQLPHSRHNDEAGCRRGSRDVRHREQSGRKRRRFDPRGSGNGRRRESIRETGRQRTAAKRASQAPAPVTKDDWRRVVEQIEEQSGFRRKLKRLFSRKKVQS
jgi:ATP-dependent RNA helicase RhlE